MSKIGAGVAECGNFFTISKFLQIVDILHQDIAESGTFADCGQNDDRIQYTNIFSKSKQKREQGNIQIYFRKCIFLKCEKKSNVKFVKLKPRLPKLGKCWVSEKVNKKENRVTSKYIFESVYS